MMDRWGMFNRFIDVWQARLTLCQSRVWLAYFRHARGDLAIVPSATIARKLGLKTSKHVQEARRELVGLGLMQVVSVGDGGLASTIQLLCPTGTPSEGVPSRGEPLTTGVGGPPIRDRGGPPRSDQGVPLFGTVLNKEEQKNTQNSSSRRDGDAAAGEKESEGVRGLERELERCGVGQPSRRGWARKLDMRHVSPAQVRRLWGQIQGHKKYRNPMGMFLTKLEDRQPPLTAGDLCAMVDAGQIESIEGHPVQPRGVGRGRAGELILYNQPCRNWDADRRPGPVDTIYAEHIEDAEIVLSQTNEKARRAMNNREKLAMDARMEGYAAIARNIGPKETVSGMELVALCAFAQIGLFSLWREIEGEVGDGAAANLDGLLDVIREEFGKGDQDGLTRLTTTCAAILASERFEKYLPVRKES